MCPAKIRPWIDGYSPGGRIFCILGKLETTKIHIEAERKIIHLGRIMHCDVALLGLCMCRQAFYLNEQRKYGSSREKSKYWPCPINERAMMEFSFAAIGQCESWWSSRLQLIDRETFQSSACGTYHMIRVNCTQSTSRVKQCISTCDKTRGENTMT